MNLHTPFRRPTAARAACTTILLFVGGVLCAVPAAAQDRLVELEETAFKQAAEVVADSIVQIRTIGGLETRDGVLLAGGPTSGLVIDSDGWIVSSAYNFAERPSSILVHLPGGKTAAARLVATDHSRMIVLLKVDHDGPLPTPPFAEGEVRVGQWSIALGKAYSPSIPNISTGIISATGRMHGRAIQTDAKVSAVNYGGPLVDIHGRVLGILVPMSPQSDTAVAGAEWYDSGIGFAVPIEQILARAEAMKEGQDQWPGRIGIALKEGAEYSTPAEVASVEPNSPADEAGLEKGDVITTIDGAAVSDQTDLFYQIKPRYAGETITVAFRRGDQTLSREVTLVDKLRPYVAGFLGILPERAADAEGTSGLAVRYVYPDSPASRAEVRPGDRLVRIGEGAIASRDDALSAMQAIAAGGEVELEIARDGESRTAAVEAVALPEQLPPDIPAPRRPAGDAPESAPETGPVSIKLPDLARQSQAYVPRTYRADVPHGLLIWLGDGGDENSVDVWTELCDRYDVVLLAPSPAEDAWQSEDLEYLSRVIPEVISRYAVDEERVAVGGVQGGGMAAFAVADQMRERVRGVVAIEASPPEQVRLASDPVQRLAILLAFDEDGENADERAQAAETLREAALPVTVVDADSETDELRATIARWVDTLDRF